MLWLPLRAYTFLVRSSPSEGAESPLGEAALLLLLVLFHHAPSAESGQHNSFRRAFTGMQARPHPPFRKPHFPAWDQGTLNQVTTGFSELHNWQEQYI